MVFFSDPKFHGMAQAVLAVMHPRLAIRRERLKEVHVGESMTHSPVLASFAGRYSGDQRHNRQDNQ